MLGGVAVETQSVAELAQSVGYVFQNPDHMIFSPTVQLELAMGPRNLGLDGAAVTTSVDAALRQFGLTPYAQQQPATLSFGLRRKVSVASVVAMQTPILILDEPTSGLDQRSSEELMAILRQRNAAGHTIILITHDMRLVAEHVPHCVVMHRGRVLTAGATREVMGQAELLSRTHLEPPQISQLGTQLGLAEPVLSVAELCQRVRPAHG
jgi:energy-coupling factor transport system ATP-binding protein